MTYLLHLFPPNDYLTIILQNRAEYHLILSRRGRRPSWLNQGIFYKIFPASRGPFSFVFADLTDGTKRDLCHGSKWTVLSMHHGYLATETSRDAFSPWSADDSHLSQLARQETPAQFCCREWRVHQNPKKVDSSSRDSCCLVYGIISSYLDKEAFLTWPQLQESKRI